MEHIASLPRESRHVRVEASGISMEEGDRLTERMKDTVLYLADVSVDSEKGCDDFYRRQGRYSQPANTPQTIQVIEGIRFQP